ncbi:hypothetical protein D3C73_986370 [compost metagenome]
MAGSPASAMPCNTLSSRSTGKYGLNAEKTAIIEAATSEAVIMALRPTASETEPINSIVSAIEMVVTDRVKLAFVGVMPKSPVISGISGCRVYSSAKVTKPAANKARLTLRNCFEPC